MGKKLKWINGDDFMGANQIEVTTCDYNGKCKRRPFAEVYPLKQVGPNHWVHEGNWSYLCFWHFIKVYLFGGFRFAWCRAKEGEENE